MRIHSILYLLLSYTISFSQSKSEHQIHSKYPDENRHFTVHLPESYSKQNYKHYPVLYLLDGQVASTYVPAVTHIFSDRDRAPEIIVVSLPSIGNRSRDYTPKGKEHDGITSGAADQFLDYIQKELIPFVDKNYRTEPFRILSGESRGGLLAMHNFIERNHLFQAYFILSPALYHNDGEITKRLKIFLSNTGTLNSFLYMNMGTEGTTFKEAFDDTWQMFKQFPVKGLKKHIEILPYDHHGLTSISGHHNAYRLLFDNWRTPFKVVDTEGAEGVRQHFESLSNLYGYRVKPPEDGVNSYARTFFSRKNYDVMLSLLELNVESYPESANAYAGLAEGLVVLGEKEEALRVMKQCLSVAKQNNHPDYNDYKALLEGLSNSK